MLGGMKQESAPCMVDHLRRTMDQLLAQVGLVMVACDDTGRLTMWSPAPESTWGEEALPDPEYLNRTPLFNADGTTPLRIEDLPLSRARSGEHVRSAVVTARPDGEHLRHLRCSASPVTGDDGRTLGAVSVTQDITAEVQADRDAALIRTRLMETINHEFRTPLSNVLGHAELLADIADTLPPRARKSAHAVHAGAVLMRNLLDVLSGLVDTAAHLRVRPAHGNLAELVRDVVAEWRPEMERRRIELAVHAPDRLAATVDPTEMHRAVAELISNASVYAPDSSTVTVTLERENGDALLTVADEGRGIPEKQRERLLQPFERGTPHPREPVNAKGMGLAVASTIAHAHGGSLTLADNDPRGLRAIVRVPGTGSPAGPAVTTGQPWVRAYAPGGAARESSTTS